MSDIEKETNYGLTSFFYYDLSERKGASLRNGLREYQFLLLATSLAVQNLLNMDLEKFDSLVGENACQIRAVKIALIASEDLDSYIDLNQRVSMALERVDELLSQKTIDRLMTEGVSLREVIDQNGLDINLNSDQSFVIQAFILSEMKESQEEGEFVSSIRIMEKSAPNKLQKIFPEVSNAFMDRLSRNLKKNLSKASVCFVQGVASFLQDTRLQKMVSPELTIHHHGWPCIPMFWAYKILLSFICKRGVPLVLHVKHLNELNDGYQVVDEEFLFYKSSPCNQLYVQTDPDENDLKMPACIIQGVACSNPDQRALPYDWKETIAQHSVFDVILAGAADHRQYPDSTKKVELHDEEYESYRKLAKNQGFSIDNPATFFIQHVYSSLVGEKYVPSEISERMEVGVFS